MSWLNIGDWFSGANTSGYQSQSDAQANTDRLLAEYKQQQQDAVDSGTITQDQADANFGQAAQVSALDSTSGAAASGFASGLTDVFTGTSSADGTKSPGIGSVVKDIIVVSVIGGVVWLFVKYGGWNWLTKLAKRMKYGWAVIIGVVLLIGGVAYYALKKTSSDAGSVAQNAFSNPIKTLFGLN